jgi:hypothetical protein
MAGAAAATFKNDYSIVCLNFTDPRFALLK